MSFVICRVKKIKSKQSLRYSLKHNLREKETKNADASLTHLNAKCGADSASQGVAMLTKRLSELEPPKRKKKDRVLALEYLLTASPEFFEKSSKQQVVDYFEECFHYFCKKMGAENLISCVYHFDEKSPHMHIHFVPVHDNKLAANKVIGGPAGLRKLQDEVGLIGNRHGLMRGVRNSKAKHQTIRQYYTKLKAAVRAKPLTNMDLFKHSMRFEQENVKAAVEGFDAMRLQIDEQQKRLQEQGRVIDKMRPREKSLKDALWAAKIEAEDAKHSENNAKFELKKTLSRTQNEREQLQQLKDELAQAKQVIESHKRSERAKIKKTGFTPGF